MKKLKALILTGAALGLMYQANAQILFSDNFNNENGTNPQLNYTGFANWNVINGAVDLIGNGSFDFYPGNGLYVDTQGSTGIGGTIQTKFGFVFSPGIMYTLSFDLGGDARSGGTRSEMVTVGSILNQTITLPSNQGLTHYSYDFSVPSDTTSPLTFAAGENGNIGLILDNVLLTTNRTPSVPEGGNTLVLGAIGFLGLAMGSRVLRRSVKA